MQKLVYDERQPELHAIEVEGNKQTGACEIQPMEAGTSNSSGMDGKVVGYLEGTTHNAEPLWDRRVSAWGSCHAFPKPGVE